MDRDTAARFVDRIVRQFDAGALPLAFDPASNSASTSIIHRGFSVEIGVGRCDQGSVDLLVGIALGAMPGRHRDAFLSQLLQWNHCTSGIGHFSLDGDGTVCMVSRHGLEGLDAEGLAGIIGAMVTASRGALETMALAELSAGVTVE